MSGTQTTETGTHELYVHRHGGRVALVAVETSEITRVALSIADGESLWVEDSETQIDVSMTIAEAGLPHRGTVHVNRCRKVETEVTYNGVPKDHRFPPSTRFALVKKWAVSKQGFKLTPTDAAEHELQISGTSIKPDDSAHIGSFAGDDCSVKLSLVAKIRNEG